MINSCTNPGDVDWDTMISHQFRGVDLKLQADRILQIRQALVARESVFCSLDHTPWIEKQGWNTDTICNWCLVQQDKCSEVIFLIAESIESRGMQLELARAIEKAQKITVIVHKPVMGHQWVKPFLEAVRFQFFTYKQDNELGRIVPW